MIVIRELSKLTYVTVGVVLHEGNYNTINNTLSVLSTLDIADIRIISSAQTNKNVMCDLQLHDGYPILNYRLNNLKSDRPFRGLRDSDCHRCHLVKDDMLILSDYHFPCVIYMREGGEPIGKVARKSLAQIRTERRAWFYRTDTHVDKICSSNCLDVCIDHNNTVEKLASF